MSLMPAKRRASGFSELLTKTILSTSGKNRQYIETSSSDEIFKKHSRKVLFIIILDINFWRLIRNLQHIVMVT